MPEISIRPAAPAEADEVGRLTERVYREDGYLDDDAEYAADLRDGAGRIADGTVLVAVAGATLVGAVTLAEAGTPWSNIAEPGELEVRMLVVDHPARRQGVADALMDAAEEEARRRGRGAVVLSTEPVMVGAHALYARRGYVRQPHRDWAVGPVSLLAYRRPLTPGAGRPSRPA